MSDIQQVIAEIQAILKKMKNRQVIGRGRQEEINRLELCVEALASISEELKHIGISLSKYARWKNYE